MQIHDALPLVISVAGFIVSFYTFSKIKKIYKRRDPILVIDFVVLGLLNLYIATLYFLLIINVIHGVAELSHLIRPANLLQIVIPAMISWRMGVR